MPQSRRKPLARHRTPGLLEMPLRRYLTQVCSRGSGRVCRLRCGGCGGVDGVELNGKIFDWMGISHAAQEKQPSRKWPTGRRWWCRPASPGCPIRAPAGPPMSSVAASTIPTAQAGCRQGAPAPAPGLLPRRDPVEGQGLQAGRRRRQSQSLWHMRRAWATSQPVLTNRVRPLLQVAGTRPIAAIPELFGYRWRDVTPCRRH